jgi:hypothetical protein
MEKYKKRDLFIHTLPVFGIRKETKELAGRNNLTGQWYEHENRTCVVFLEWRGKLLLTTEQKIALSILSLVTGLSSSTKSSSFAYYK